MPAVHSRASDAYDPYLDQKVGTNVRRTMPFYVDGQLVLADLIEGSRTNVVLHSHDITNIVWVSTDLSITPLGSGLFEIENTSGATKHLFQEGIILADNTAHTASVKATLVSGSAASLTVFADPLVPQVVTSITEATETRYQAKFTTATPASVQYKYYISIPNNTTIRVRHFQLEEGTFASTYIETAALTTVRAADLLINDTTITNTTNEVTKILIMKNMEGVGYVSSGNPTYLYPYSYRIARSAITQIQVGIRADSTSVTQSVTYATLPDDVDKADSIVSVIASFKSGNSKVYINGVEQSNNANTWVSINNIIVTLELGRTGYEPFSYMIHLLDNVKAWSDAEALTFHNSLALS